MPALQKKEVAILGNKYSLYNYFYEFNGGPAH